MNFKQPLYGRVTIGANQTSLGFAKLPDLAERMIRTCAKSRSTGTHKCTIEFSETPFNDSAISDSQRLELEFAQLSQNIILNSDDEAFPGVTTSRALEAYQSTSGQAYQFLAVNPDKRLNIPSEEITRIRQEYESEFPDVAPHWPVWKSP